MLLQGKWDEGGAELCKLSVSVDVTGKMAGDLDHSLTMLGSKFRSPACEEPILSAACQEAALRHRMTACQQQYAPDHPQAEKIQQFLAETAHSLAELLLSAARAGEAESIAQLGATTLRAQFDAARANGAANLGRAYHRLVRALSQLCRVYSDLERPQEIETILVELVAVHNAQAQRF
eukprot:207318-Prymnesium_polylepis.1